MTKFATLEAPSSYRHIARPLNTEARKYRLVTIAAVHSVPCGMLLCDSPVKTCGVPLLYVRAHST